MTLYTFAKDAQNKSNCTGACARNWPPAHPGAKTPPGLSKQKLTTIMRADGAKQLALGGKPLYTFVGDKRPGDANGNGLNEFGGIWTDAAAGRSSATSAPAPSYGGY
jgi:predicted lipoprotein with Yx(FWY)xxD motif